MAKTALASMVVAVVLTALAVSWLAEEPAVAQASLGTPTPPRGAAGAAPTFTPTPTSQRPWKLTVEVIDTYPSPAVSGMDKTWVVRAANHGSQWGCESLGYGWVSITLSDQTPSTSFVDVSGLGCDETVELQATGVVTASPGGSVSIDVSAFNIPYPNSAQANDGVCASTAPHECGPDSDGDGCHDPSEQQRMAGTQSSGGMRDHLDSNDYFNPTHDGQNRVDDVLLVVGQYFVDSGDPAYNPDTDRTWVGPNDWNSGPPNGQQRVDDILTMVKQYFHDCG